jgi:hypothetical protein
MSSLRLSEGDSFSNHKNEKQEAPVRVAATLTSRTGTSSSKAWSNVTTYAFAVRDIYSGYRNQMMAFTMLILRTKREGHGQFLAESVRQKDTYGTNKFMPFDFLWDVDHWNSYYPAGLPRLVDYDPILHDQWDPDNHRFRRLSDNENETSTTRPYGYHGKIPKLMAGYQRYVQGKGGYALKGGHRNPAEILMFQGALKPHPALQAIIDRILLKEMGSDPYMTLHARIEPDMQRHPVCRQYKVTNLTDIILMLEQHFPDGPPDGVSTVFVPVNRQYLEKEGYPNEKDPSKTNWIAVENLRVLNRIALEGLWKGRARVLEFGSKELKGSRYEELPSTAGAILNYFVAIGANVFVGTEVSSYSHDLLATRFYRNHMENYKYRPDGLHPWTPPGTVDPPGHRC